MSNPSTSLSEAISHALLSLPYDDFPSAPTPQPSTSIPPPSSYPLVPPQQDVITSMDDPYSAFTQSAPAATFVPITNSMVQEEALVPPSQSVDLSATPNEGFTVLHSRQRPQEQSTAPGFFTTVPVATSSRYGLADSTSRDPAQPSGVNMALSQGGRKEGVSTAKETVPAKEKDGSERELVRLPFTRRVHRNKFKNMTRGDLEEFVMQKVCEALTDGQTESVVLRKRTAMMDDLLKRQMTKIQGLQKQVQDMKVVIGSFQKKRAEGQEDVRPVIITRHVGVQFKTLMKDASTNTDNASAEKSQVPIVELSSQTYQPTAEQHAANRPSTSGQGVGTSCQLRRPATYYNTTNGPPSQMSSPLKRLPVAETSSTGSPTQTSPGSFKRPLPVSRPIANGPTLQLGSPLKRLANEPISNGQLQQMTSPSKQPLPVIQPAISFFPVNVEPARDANIGNQRTQMTISTATPYAPNTGAVRSSTNMNNVRPYISGTGSANTATPYAPNTGAVRCSTNMNNVRSYITTGGTGSANIVRPLASNPVIQSGVVSVMRNTGIPHTSNVRPQAGAFLANMNTTAPYISYAGTSIQPANTNVNRSLNFNTGFQTVAAPVNSNSAGPSYISNTAVATPVSINRAGSTVTSPDDKTNLQALLPKGSRELVAKLAPPKLNVFVRPKGAGVVINWTYNLTSDYEEISIYEIWYKQSIPAKWRRVQALKALPLPMKCVVNKLPAGPNYYFGIVAIDVLERTGPMSMFGPIDVGCVDLG